MGVVLQFPKPKRLADQQPENLDFSQIIPPGSVSVKIDADMFREMLETIAFYQVAHPDDGERARATMNKALE
jgi:hypothetical protein